MSSLGLGCDRMGMRVGLGLMEFPIDSIRFLMGSFFMCRLVVLAF